MVKSKGTTHKQGQCMVCQGPDDEQMVQCDDKQCGIWYHLNCVGLTEERARGINWICNLCEAGRKQLGDASKIGSFQDFGAEICSTLIPENVTSVEVNRATQELQRLNTQAIAKSTEQRKEIETNLPRVKCTLSIHSNASKISMSSLLMKKLELIEEKRRLMKEERLAIDEALNEIQNEEDRISQISDIESLRSRLGDFHESAPQELRPSISNPITGVQNFDDDEIVRSRQPDLNLKAKEFKPAVPTAMTRSSAQPVNEGNQTMVNPMNMYQWTARQSIGKELPIFMGRAEEWPIFIAAYENTTIACGFNDHDNLARLQKSIKGFAREMVESLMYSPDCVSRVIMTLKRLFGRPEQILSAQIEKIRKEPPVNEERPETLIRYATTVQNLWAILSSAEMKRHMDNPMLLQELVDKLPHSFKYKWAEYVDQSEYDIATFVRWLEVTVDKICLVNPAISLTSRGKSNQTSGRVTNLKFGSSSDNLTKKNYKLNVHSPTVDELSNETKCIACSGSCKQLKDCLRFIGSDHSEKWRIIKGNGVCRQCLKKHKMRPLYRCVAAVRCNVPNCKGQHHPLMHFSLVEKSTEPVTEGVIKETNCNHSLGRDNLQFRYMPVKLRNGEHSIHTIAFMDEGSTGTFMDEELANELQAYGPKSVLCIKHTSNVHRSEPDSMRLSLKISGVYSNAREYNLNGVQTIKSLSLEPQTMKYDDLVKKFIHLKNIPVSSYEDAEPRLLIGLNNWKLAMPTRTRMGSCDEPIATKCALGWTIFAAMVDGKNQSVHYCSYINENPVEQRDHQLHDMVKTFFSTESLGVQPAKNDVASKEECRAIEIMKKTTKYVGNRFETGLLWKHDEIKLPDSKPMALRRMYCFEERMERNPEVATAMKKHMEDYIAKAYVRKLSSDEVATPQERIWYLPVFLVNNPNKPGKTRVVFDGAAQAHGVSLNSALLKGPDQVSSLLGVLLRFREGKVAVSGDIKEMFHQVQIKHEDQHCQRFLWRSDAYQDPETYILQVMTFGATCSPSSAQYVKNINAKRFEQQHPRAVKSIIFNTYVDDLLDSFESLDDAFELITQIRNIHREGGFEIRNWKSNSTKLMQLLDEDCKNESTSINMDLESADTEKVLGLWWCLGSDSLKYSLKFNKGNKDVLNGVRKPTKREVLRILMSVFNPLGLITHYISYLKVLLQDIWRSKVSWDDVIEDQHLERWHCWIKVLPRIEQLKIPRCYLKSFESWANVDVQLHIFVDASAECSAATAYLRLRSHGKIECALVAARSKVAPIKLVSIPRLELSAALMGARLSRNSKTVLSWLRSDTRSIKGQFVAFRVSEIQDITNIHEWRYVPSKNNVADDATKWKKTLDLDANDRWFNAPSFLYEPESDWPKNITLTYQTTDEMKTVAVH